ncbi:ABC transporter substrate-binding protein [Halomonas sp. FeN2]|uniref:ABC transporter substrate-binding protein n=1 Tax=Vreelandella neptunia TaxID=115551 RepID=A0ABZ0YIX5_9GAMM|nr:MULTISPECIES: ABC transporter substrate-binding protein [Halomonas]TDV97680.1 iron complex transport system substrate-binding protein [Halomonas alkaliantarctica]MBF58043.1 ABC transporter substrate-binding protein [Halomonas sp.]MDN3562367.1 ABC transporter substrate-binding protein [Halomonas neptunia]UBR51404.1 ABC transporter substrate-binding protein [Halomonas sp. FeN2]WQH12055.1 ABC transporter substrate-binding protein [Halomonas neptunia]
MKFAITTTAMLLAAASATASADQRIATFDLGSLDTLDALGLKEQVVGVPKASLPDYLEQYAADDVTNIGGLRSPDMDALGESEPSLILYTGRQGEWEEELSEIAPLLNTSLQGDDYLTAFDANIRELASRLAVEGKAEEALGILHAEIETQREALSNAPSTLVVTHNGGNLMLNQHPVVHDVLGVATVEMPASVTSETRGTRTFTPLSPEAISEIDPEVLLVVDRSAAIGDEPADADALAKTLLDAGAEKAQVVMLTPALWYLSGGGLQSLALQVEEVAAALNSSGN